MYAMLLEDVNGDAGFPGRQEPQALGYDMSFPETNSEVPRGPQRNPIRAFCPK